MKSTKIATTTARVMPKFKSISEKQIPKFLPEGLSIQMGYFEGNYILKLDVFCLFIIKYISKYHICNLCGLEVQIQAPKIKDIKVSFFLRLQSGHEFKRFSPKNWASHWLT